jgi:hypothetical protein
VGSKVSIEWRYQTAEQPGFHFYEDALDSFGAEAGAEQPVYLRLDGIAAEMQALSSRGASVTLTLPRELARSHGLLPSEFTAPGKLDSARR